MAISGANDRSKRRRMTGRGADIARLTIAPLFVGVGIVHLLRPSGFASVMPLALPYPHAVILLTGVAELAGAIGLFIARTRLLAGSQITRITVTAGVHVEPDHQNRRAGASGRLCPSTKALEAAIASLFSVSQCGARASPICSISPRSHAGETLTSSARASSISRGLSETLGARRGRSAEGL
jgi:hypothetical protein